MTVHYHGTPITPRAQLLRLAGRHFCVSFARRDDAAVVDGLAQGVLLDNGAYSIWTGTARATGDDWSRYYEWAEHYLARPTTWAVVPDVIDGGAELNDALLKRWPFGDRGAPVWHLDEPLDRLARLCDEWPRVCFGSSGAFSTVGSPAWHRRMEAAFNLLCPTGPPPVWLHMLRGMKLADGPYPFASLDSTDVGANHNRPQNDVVAMARRWDTKQTPREWSPREWLEFELEPQQRALLESSGFA